MHPKEPTDRVISSPGRANHKIINVHLATVDRDQSDSAIVVGRRVSAGRGLFLPLLPGQRRAQRARKYGNTAELADEHTWKVPRDDGVGTMEKSAAMRVEAATAGSRRSHIGFNSDRI